MKLVNITKCCKRLYPSLFKYVISRIKESEIPEAKARFYVTISTFVCFTVGMSYDTVVYGLTSAFPLLATNLAALAVYAASAYFFFRGRLNIPKMLSVLLFTVQANVAVTLFYHHNFTVEHDKFIISSDLFIGFLVCVLASLTKSKAEVNILCAIPLGALAVVLAIHFPAGLIQYFPSLCLAYTSPPVLLAYIRIFLWEVLRTNEQLLREKELLYHLMQMTEKHKLGFTPNEVYLCSLILEDKSIPEISKLLNINESSVRANRSRIRTKMKLEKKDSLKGQLMLLAGGEKA